MILFALLTCLSAEGGGFSWDVPEASRWVDVPGTLDVQGIPIKLKAVQSKWEANALLQHMADRFVAAGLFISEPRKQPQLLKQVQLTALDPNTLHTFTVIFEPNPDRTTTLYLSEAAPAARKPPATSDLPVFPGARAKFSSNLEGARTLSYLAGAKREEIHQFYAETLGAAGFSSRGEGRFAREGVELEIRVKPEGAAQRVLLWERADRR